MAYLGITDTEKFVKGYRKYMKIFDAYCGAYTLTSPLYHEWLDSHLAGWLDLIVEQICYKPKEGERCAPNCTGCIRCTFPLAHRICRATGMPKAMIHPHNLVPSPCVMQDRNRGSSSGPCTCVMPRTGKGKRKLYHCGHE
jgi:hypothetical protein